MITTFVKSITSDKLVLHGLLYTPDKKTKKLILHIHGMAGNFYENKFLEYMSRTFTDAGIAFLSVNTRGHDFIADFAIDKEKHELKRIGNSQEKFEECVHDISAWMDVVEKEGFTEIILQGHSLGASKVVYYLVQTKDKRVKKLSLLSPADMIGLTEKWEGFSETMTKAQRMVKEKRGEELLPVLVNGWDVMSAETFIDFSTRGNAIDIFNTYDPEAPSIISEVKTPIFALFGNIYEAYITEMAKDTLEIIHKKAKNCPSFEAVVIRGANHSYATYEQKVADTIAEWAKR